MTKLSLPVSLRVQAAALRAALALPRSVRRMLAGAPIRRDGQTLDLDAQLMLRMLRLGGVSLISDPDDVDKSRADFELAQRGISGPLPERVADREIVVTAEHCDVACTLYEPEGIPDPGGLLVFFHGGGWAVGSRRSHNGVARFLAERAGVRVLSAEYRLGPEHAFPAAADDALAVFDFAYAHAGDLGVDAARIAVGGDSAGGNLAASTAYAAARRGGPKPAFQMLLYPATDLAGRSRTRDLFADGFFLDEQQITWCYDRYAPAAVDRRDPRLSVLLAEDLSGLPSAYIATAGFDPLRDEGEAYAQRLAQAGVPVVLSRQADLFHGYASLLGLGHRFREATAEAAHALSVALGAAHARG